MERRAEIIAEIPPDLSEQDQKRYIYERTYGEPLPEDFFDRKNKKKNPELTIFARFASSNFAIFAVFLRLYPFQF